MVRWHMPKSKLSVTLDPVTLERARELIEVSSVSQLLDVALARLIESEEERLHIAGYVRTPTTREFEPLADVERLPLEDDVDWAALYGMTSKRKS
jgi:hypothetical protein